MSFNITRNIVWTGKIDWELRKFHGEELSTHFGSTYNSYLIKDEKIALIDTVWSPYAEEFVENLKKEIDLHKIDFIVCTHGEPDHSGALPALMEQIPHVPIYCTANAVKSLKGQYHMDWNFNVVKTGDRLNLGKRELTFIEAPMLHWPDTMFCCLSEDNILFSSDAFGQHYACGSMFNDTADQAELYREAMKYYANILTPFSRLVAKKIEELKAMGLKIEMICPSHGVIWRNNPLQIVETYIKWANDYQENQVTIVYDTMWNATRIMAERIAEGIKEANSAITVKVYNAARSDKNDILTEIFRSKAVLVGSSTVNRGYLSHIAAILEEIRGLGFKSKQAAAFGSYGWSGEAVKQIAGKLAECDFSIIDEGLKLMWYPGEQEIESCLEYGRKIGSKLQ